MGLISYKLGQTSVVLRVFIQDSSVTTGAGLTGLSSASSGLIISTIADNESSATAYTVAGSTIETISTLGTYAAPTATKCRFKEVDSTNHKGVYEVQIADARFAVSSAKSLLVSITGATNAVPCHAVIPLSQFDPYDVVRAGLTALPNAAAEASGGLYTRGTGAGQIRQDANGTIGADVYTIKTQTVTCAGGVTVPAATLASTTNITAASGITVSTNSDKTGYSLTATTGLGNQTANITGNLSGSVGSVTGLTASDVGAIKTKTDFLPSATAGAAGGVTIAGSNAATTFATLTSTGAFTINGTSQVAQTGDSYAQIGVAGAGLTALGDTRLANLDATVSSRSTLTQTQVSGGAYSLASASFVCGDTRLANLNATVSSRLAGTSYTAPDPTAIANAVWLYSSDLVTLDEAYSTSIAKTVIDSGGSSAAAIADAVWDEAQSGHTVAGSFGKYLDTTISSRATSVGAGSGARTVTITVNDGTTALQNAIVRMTEGVNTYTATTNVSGVATFNLDDATYTVSISKAGYSFSGTTLAVSGTTTQTYSMSAITITPPADPALTAAYLTTYDAQGGIAGSTVISFKLEDGSGTTGYSYSTTTFTGTSNASTGLLTINLIKSTSYSARRGTGEWVDFTTGTGSTYALPEILGTA